MQVARIRRVYARFGDRFARYLLTPAEYTRMQSHAHPERFLAKRFAAKEAAVKALGTGFSQGISFQHIAVSHLDSGQPILTFEGVAKALVTDHEITQHFISLSDEKEYAMAYVTLVCG